MARRKWEEISHLNQVDQLGGREGKNEGKKRKKKKRKKEKRGVRSSTFD